MHATTPPASGDRHPRSASDETGAVRGRAEERIPARLWPAILLLGLALRLSGLGWGLPDAVEPDEPKLVHHALAFGLGDLDPHYYHYPHLLMYLLFGCYALLFVVLVAAGRIEGVSGFEAMFLGDATLFYVLARGVIVLFAAGSLFLVFRLGRRLYGSSAAGLLASLALAVLPVDVLFSHYARADVPVTFFMLLGLWHVARIPEERGTRRYALAGVAMGLATATKYTGLILLIPILVAQGMAFRSVGLRASLRNLAVALAAGFLCFFLTSPYSVINWRETLDGIGVVSQIKYEGQFGIPRGSSWTTYLQVSFLDGLLPVLCLAGLLYSIARRQRGDLILLSLVLPYFAVVAPSQSQSLKYLVPLGPPLSLLAARLAVDLSERSGRRRGLKVAVGFVFAAAVASSLWTSVGIGRDLVREDTRSAARAWIEENVPSGATVALEWGGETVRLRESEAGIEQKIARYCRLGVEPYALSSEQLCEALRQLKELPSDRPAYRIVVLGSRVGKSDRLSADNMDLEHLASLGVDFVVTSSASVEPDRELLRRAYPAWAGFYDDLDERAELVRRFDGTPDRFPSRESRAPPIGASGDMRGPTVRIYRVPAAGAD